MSYNSATDSIINLDTSVNVSTITDYTTLGTEGLVLTTSVVGTNPVSLVSLDSDSSIKILTRTLPGTNTVAPDLNTISGKPSVSLVSLDSDSSIKILTRTLPGTNTVAPDLNTISGKPSVSLVTLDVGNTLSNLEEDTPTTGRIQYWN